MLIILSSLYCYSMDMQNPQLYLGLCAEFWDFDKPIPPAKEYALFRHYVAQSTGPILEPMCGTGRYLIPLVEEGFKIDGFDASKFMFDSLCKKCTEKNITPHVWRQFLELVPETKKYNLIFIPDTSFALFTDLSHVKKCLSKIYALLLPGGKFVFDVQTIHSRWGKIGLWAKKAYKKPDGNMIVENYLPMPIVDSISPVMLRYELMEATGKILKTEEEYYPIRLYRPDEMGNLLRDVGFKTVKQVKAHDITKTPSKRDAVIVYECIK